MKRNLMTSAQVAARLGVELQTVYAYVSRGVLSRTLDGEGRSRFEPGEVEALARRGRPRQGSRQVGSVEVSLATTLTRIEPERLSYRGRDARELAQSASFEAVAELLWSGELDDPALTWPRPSHEVPAGRALVKRATPLERLAAGTAVLACAHPLRLDLRPNTVIAHARALLSALVELLPRVAPDAERGSARRIYARRLWPRLSPLPPSTGRVQLLNAALVLLADHELATSTLAARVAASTRADPFAVVLAGLGALSGPLHGKAAYLVHELMIRAGSVAPELALAHATGEGGRIPGFGHPLYTRDPRAACLLELLEPALKAGQRKIIDELRARALAAGAGQPNSDYALGAIAFAMDMPLGATEAVFALARIAGFVAHALEEYGEAPLRFRARAVYIGR